MAGVLTPKKYCAKSLKKHTPNYKDFSKILMGDLFRTLSVILQVGYLKQYTFKIIKTNWKDYGIFYMNMIGWVS